MIDYQRSQNWWSQQAKAKPIEAGILAVGGSGDSELEIIYRQYAEWRHFRRFAHLKRTMNVLEIGCGAGRWALQIAPYVNHVVAFDFSEEMIKLACQRQAKAGLANKIDFSVASAANFHFSHKFDLIYFGCVLQYLDDADCRRAIACAKIALATNGIIIDRSSYSIRIREVFDDKGYQAIYRTEQELESFFAEAGFKNTYHRPSYPPMRLPGRLMVRPRISTGLASSLRRFPTLTYLSVRTVSKLVNLIRPLPQESRLSSRSHDFFRYEFTERSI